MGQREPHTTAVKVAVYYTFDEIYDLGWGGGGEGGGCSEHSLLLLLLKGVGGEGELGRTNEKNSPRVSYDVIYLATLGLPLCLSKD